MHVGLDLLFLSGRAGGVETYVRGLVPALLRARPALRLTGFVPRGSRVPEWLDGVDLVPVGLSGPVRVSMPIAQSIRLPLLARRTQLDLMHSPANFSPLLGTVPLVVTVHDLLHRREPQLVGPVTRAGVRAFVDGPARRARRIITVSEASAVDIVRYLGRDRADIDVTPPAAGAVHPPDQRVLRRPDRAQVLSVGSARPHKNLNLLVGALARIPRQERPLLVLPGIGLESVLGPRVTALGLTQDVWMPGWVSDQELERLYATSSLYLCPSLFEGFGLPVLEAMTRGVPVACSDLPVLREVTGDAAVTFDPRSEQCAADAMRDLLSDPVRAADLAARGRVRAAWFSWDRTAELTLVAYERALGNSPQALS